MRRVRKRRDLGIDKVLIENFVSLQKAITNLSIKFEDLSDQISKLLNLFEISAKALVEKEVGSDRENKETKKIIENLDRLLEQNKILARGITLIHDKTNEIVEEETSETPKPQQQVPIKLQNISVPKPASLDFPQSTVDLSDYQKSISGRDRKFNPQLQ